jgi:hypothetical protein
MELRHWWLNANPDRWDPRKWKLGETQVYTSHTEDGTACFNQNHFKMVKPGDPLITYVAAPVKAVTAIFHVTHGLNETPYGEGFRIRKSVDFKHPVPLTVLRQHPLLSISEPLKIGLRGSLLGLRDFEYAAILALCYSFNPDVSDLLFNVRNEEEPTESSVLDDLVRETTRHAEALIELSKKLTQRS